MAGAGNGPGNGDNLSRLTRACNEALQAINSMNDSDIRSLASESASAPTNTRRPSEIVNELARCFPTHAQRPQRQSSSRRRTNPTSSTSKSAPSSSKRGRPANVTAHRDLIIIPNPDTSVVPTHKSRVRLEKKGLVVHEFPINRDWNPVELRIAIRKQLPRNDVPFEFVKSCYGELVTPKLAEGVGLSAEVVLKLCGQGCIYIRCLEPIDLEDGDDSDTEDDYHEEKTAEHPPTCLLSQNTRSSCKTEVFPSTPIHVDSDEDGLEKSVFDTEMEPIQINGASASFSNANCEASCDVQPTCTETDNNLERAGSNEPSTCFFSLKIHRSNVKEDMLTAFGEPDILSKSLDAVIVDHLGKEEKGTGSGVLREIFSLFWKEAYDSFMVGVNERVPYIRHDYNRCKWEAVGRILIKGFNECSFFPLKLCKSFIAAAILGDQRISTSMHLESFVNYVSTDEAEVIKKCMSNQIKSDDEGLNDLLSDYDCKRVVKDDNIMDVLGELAHKELVQKPQYVVECWKYIIAPLKLIFPTIEALNDFYSRVTPSNAKVLGIIKSQPSTAAETECLSHLKRYIRGLNGENLIKFLRFTTGAEILVTDTLTVTFYGTEGFQRRPIAHTCGFCLELPSTYESFCDLREEFSAVLNYENWSFDIQ